MPQSIFLQDIIHLEMGNSTFMAEKPCREHLNKWSKLVLLVRGHINIMCLLICCTGKGTVSLCEIPAKKAQPKSNYEETSANTS